MDIYERKEAEVPDKRTAKMLYQSGDAPTVWGGGCGSLKRSQVS